MTGAWSILAVDSCACECWDRFPSRQEIGIARSDLEDEMVVYAIGVDLFASERAI